MTASLAFSIVFFTIILKASTLLIDVPPTFWTSLSGGIVLFLGFTYLFPHAWSLIGSKLGFGKVNASLDKAQDIRSSNIRAIVT